MKKQWKRLLIAALISATVFALTFYWYQESEQKIRHDRNGKPLAFVGKVFEDIQRRPAARLLWQIVNTGEPLYDGEAIRTSSTGEVRIQFADSDRYLDLEPDSLIVIKKSEDVIALELMEGSLFVNAANSTKDSGGLVLESADETVDISRVSAALTKSAGKAIEVHVLKGEASIQNQDGSKKSVTEKSPIQILSPSLLKDFFVNGDNIQPVPFKWQGVPSENTVEIWAGSSRKKLSLIQTISAEIGQTKIPLGLGKHYWKIISRQNNQTYSETPIYKTEVSPRFPPTILFPPVDTKLPAYSEYGEVTFRWQKGQRTQAVRLKVSRDSDFKEILFDQKFTHEESYLMRGMTQGAYYWQVSSYYDDSDIIIAGKPIRFTLEPAEQLKAQLASTLKVRFLQSDRLQVQQYVLKPELQLQWQAENNQDVVGWRLRIYQEGSSPDQAQLFEVPTQSFTAPVSNAGRYIASVEALNKQGYVIGTNKSEPITLELKPFPLAPTFIPEGSLQSEADGRVLLKWTPIPDAKEYALKIIKNGKELRATNYRTVEASLKNLLPGQYELELTSIDEHGRSSQNIEKRTLSVPELSNIRAPAVKRIQVD